MASGESMDKRITIEDVEIAIKIIEAYLKNVRKAQLMLSRITRLAGTGSPTSRMTMPHSFDDFIRIALQMQKEKESEVSEEIETRELTDEELKRIREIAKKFK